MFAKSKISKSIHCGVCILFSISLCFCGCAFADNPEKNNNSQNSNNTNTSKTTNATSSKTTITISAIGDCTLGKDAAFSYSSSLPAKYKQKGAAYFFSGVKKVLNKDDLTIANLEGTLSKRGSRQDKTFAFRGKPSYTKILKSGSVEAVTFANNHACDYGTVSYKDTIKYVKKANIKCASYSKISTYTTKGIKIGMVAVNDIGDANAKKLIKSGIKKLKKRNVSLITVSIHAGIERDYYPSARQKSLAHYAVKKGANLVLGHHPHVLQGIEKYKGVYIAYSLGNFCFGGNSNPTDKLTMILQQSFTFKDGKLQKKASAKQLKVIPCSLSSHSSYNDYKPKILKGTAKKSGIKRINKYSKRFGIKFLKSGKIK